MPNASKQHRQVVRTMLSAGGLLLLVFVCGCSAAVPHAPVTAAQRVALTRVARRDLWLNDGDTHVACPVDVLGAAHIGRRLHVYTVVQCSSFDQRCVNDVSFTAGLVAELTGTKVVGVQLDDAEGYQGMISEADIYPSSLRSAALNYINSGGPASLRQLAAEKAGCPGGA
jgi:hypothetical protein